ncbi:MAG: hypothetical protein AAGK00_03695 [Pseudomonadota bacterium]
MRTGATISGGLHAALVVAAVVGFDWFKAAEPVPFTVTEIEMVDGQDFEAALSTAPIVQSEGPADLAPPAEGTSVPETPDQLTDLAAPDELPVLTEAEAPDETPERPIIQRRPPPTPVPTEPELPSIAEIPSPDPLDRQAAAPESPATTEPVMPLQSLAPPTPADKPQAPPQIEPEPEPVEETPETPQTPDPEAVAESEPEPQPEQEPEPEATAEAQPEAPQGPAPQEAAIPVARDAELAAAAQAARAAEEAQRRQEQPQPQEQPTPNQQAGGSQSEFAARLTRGERDALRVAIKPYYVYAGDQSDRSLQVIIRVRLNQDGSLNGKPEQRSAAGGNASSQRALFQAGRRALIRAAAAGEFQRLPADKYQRWKVLNFRFSVTGLERMS